MAKWRRNGAALNTPFQRVEFASEKDAQKMLEALEHQYMLGQQSVLSAIAQLAGMPDPFGGPVHDGWADVASEEQG